MASTEVISRGVYLHEVVEEEDELEDEVNDLYNELNGYDNIDMVINLNTKSNFYICHACMIYNIHLMIIDTGLCFVDSWVITLDGGR